MKCLVTDFGATTDGKLCTKPIQTAIDTCFLAGGGEVIIPEGCFLTGGLRLRSNVTLHLMENAVLAGSTNPEDYLTYLNDEIEPINKEDLDMPAPTVMPQCYKSRSAKPYSRWNNAVIRAINAKNIAIIGEKNAIISGQNCYDELGEENYRGPHGINMWFCENVTLSGYTFKDSGNWAHAIQNSKNIHADGITVLGGHDGFDIRTCDDVVVENATFYSGDDAIAGFDNINVVVRNSLLNSSCSAMRFGGTNVLVENCTVAAPNKYGFRGHLTMEQKMNRADTDENCRHNCLNAFLYYCDYRAKIRKTPGDILIKNCRFENVDAVFSQVFGHVWACNRALDNIMFEDCVFDGVCSPINISCPEEEPMTFKMKNCTITAREGARDLPVAKALHFRDIIFENVIVSGFDAPRIVVCSDGNVQLHNSTPMSVEKGDKIEGSAQ